ncbi:MAG: transposase, partial [Hallella bergensis]
VMKSKSSIKSTSSATGTKDSEVKALQAEIRRLKKELAHESLRADAFNELINVIEKQFNISIQKKAGAKQ